MVGCAWQKYRSTRRERREFRSCPESVPQDNFLLAAIMLYWNDDDKRAVRSEKKKITRISNRHLAIRNARNSQKIHDGDRF
jgi:hypothetical protein